MNVTLYGSRVFGVKIRSLGQVLFQYDGCSYKKGELGPETGKILPSTFGRKTAVQHLDLGLLASRTETIHVCCSCHPVCGTLLRQSQEVHTQGQRAGQWYGCVCIQATLSVTQRRLHKAILHGEVHSIQACSGSFNSFVAAMMEYCRGGRG